MKEKSSIALVDDERNILTSLRMALEAEGYRVRTYSDGVAALEALTEEPADLGARIEAVKSASTIREIEAILRDSGGFSRGDAVTLMSRMKSVLQGELAAEAKAQREIAAIFEKTYF